jgi:ribosomal protein S18 acetylase RimI-like enzyme
MRLFPAVGPDFPEIVALVNAAYRGIGAAPGWTSSADFIEGPRTDEASLRAELAANPDAVLFTLRELVGSPLMGCVWLEPDGPDAWYLALLAVRPNVQDRQLGRTILAEVEELARQRGMRCITLAVNCVRETLIAWYQRRGYVPTDETRPYEEGFGKPLRPDLHLVVLERRV